MPTEGEWDSSRLPASVVGNVFENNSTMHIVQLVHSASLVNKNLVQKKAYLPGPEITGKYSLSLTAEVSREPPVCLN